YVLHQDGRHLEALEMLSAACQQFRIYDGAVPADVYEHLGMVREALGDKAKALREYQQALDAGTRPGGRLPAKTGSRIRAAMERLRP
ncbi:MAG: tetratricopeptide repeat protein, partial [Phycisphaerae bacterium]|nr:tetratricopeptide repeat protein [Phycisphaerae bacterium]